MLFKNLCGILIKRRTVSINLIEICFKPFLNLWWMTSCYILKVRQDKLVGFSNLSRYPAKEVAKYVVELLPVLCEHLEATSGFFQVNVLTTHFCNDNHILTSCLWYAGDGTEVDWIEVTVGLIIYFQREVEFWA